MKKTREHTSAYPVMFKIVALKDQGYQTSRIIV